MLAVVRDSSNHLPLLIHVAGAIALVGLLASSLVLAGIGAPARTTFRMLLLAALPAWVVMRVGAQLIADEQGWLDLDEPPAWIDIGFITAEPPLLLLIVATVAAWRASKATDGEAPRWTTAVLALALIATLVGLWAMVAKPS